MLERPQDRQDNGMIPTQAHYTWVSPVVFLGGWVVQYLSVSLFHLLESMCSIERGNGNISTVDLFLIIN